VFGSLPFASAGTHPPSTWPQQQRMQFTHCGFEVGAGEAFVAHDRRAFDIGFARRGCSVPRGAALVATCGIVVRDGSVA
jgi:hypothetical protein